MSVLLIDLQKEWQVFSLTCFTVIAIPARNNLYACIVSSKIECQRRVDAGSTFQSETGSNHKVASALPSGNLAGHIWSMCMGQRLRQGQNPAQQIHASEPASVFIFLSATHIATGS